MNETMVERVARAIDPVWFMHPEVEEEGIANYPGHTKWYRDRARKAARAAIEAMHDPSPMMLAMVWRRFDMRGSGSTPAFKEAFNCMIDAALAESPAP